MAEKKEGCASGLVLGSTIKFIVLGIGVIAKIIARLLLFFGLWLPVVYIIFGVILFTVYGFNPLDWTLEGQLYISGLVSCFVCSIIISIRNIIVKPIKSVFAGYNKPLWIKEDKNVTIKVSRCPKQNTRIPKADNIVQERPNIYYSKIEDNTLVHEYNNRFEIYKIENNKARLDRVEYKNEG